MLAFKHAFHNPKCLTIIVKSRCSRSVRVGFELDLSHVYPSLTQPKLECNPSPLSLKEAFVILNSKVANLWSTNWLTNEALGHKFEFQKVQQQPQRSKQKGRPRLQCELRLKQRTI
ncbi:hypothetical protein GQ457_04G005810 [Hibiscus cannabinus]